MAFNWDDIEPRLLDPRNQLAAVGGSFVGDHLTSEDSQWIAETIENALSLDTDASMDLDAPAARLDPNSNMTGAEYGHTFDTHRERDLSIIAASHGVDPVELLSYPTPPRSPYHVSSAQYPEANRDFGGHQLRVAGSIQDGILQRPSAYGSDGGFLTPDSASRGCGRSIPSHFPASSPVADWPQRPTIISRPPSRAAPTPPMINSHSSRQAAPAPSSMADWADGMPIVGTKRTDLRDMDRVAAHIGRGSRAPSAAAAIGQGTVICDGAPGKFCGKKFKSKSARTHHARCHLPPRAFCSICDSGFFYQKDLTRHMKTHGPRDRHLICNNMGCKYHTRPFARQDHRDRHVRNCRHSQVEGQT